MSLFKKKIYLGAFTRLCFNEFIKQGNKLTYQDYLKADSQQCLSKDTFDKFYRELSRIYYFSTQSYFMVQSYSGKIKYSSGEAGADITTAFVLALEDNGYTDKDKVALYCENLIDEYKLFFNSLPEDIENNLTEDKIVMHVYFYFIDKLKSECDTDEYDTIVCLVKHQCKFVEKVINSGLKDFNLI